MARTLDLEVFVGGENAFYVTSTIVSGERDAVVIDSQFTRSDASRLGERLKQLGKNVTMVYLTHGHPDHYWGFTTLREYFPDARLVTAPEVIDVIEDLIAAEVAQWKPLYGDEVPDEPIKPEPLRGDTIELEGNDLQVLHIGQGDVRNSTAVWIPSRSAIVSGDTAFNGTHVWLAEADANQRQQWIANLDKLATRKPSVVVAGHKAPDASDVGSSVFLRTKEYIAAFDEAAKRSSSSQNLITSMSERYRDRALPMILDIAAQAAFPKSA